jgi:hypothetical protein
MGSWFYCRRFGEFYTVPIFKTLRTKTSTVKIYKTPATKNKTHAKISIRKPHSLHFQTQFLQVI